MDGRVDWVQPRKWIDLDRQGLARLGCALWPCDDRCGGLTFKIGRTVQALMGEGADVQRGMIFQPNWHPEWEENVVLRAKDFHWSVEHFKANPALWAHCEADLPSTSQWIDQETPISARAWPEDVVLSLLRLFGILAAKELGEDVTVFAPAVLETDRYTDLLFARAAHKPVKTGRPRARDSVYFAALGALSFQLEEFVKGRDCTDRDAAIVVVADATWRDLSSGRRAPGESVIPVDCRREDGDGNRLAVEKVIRKMRALRATPGGNPYVPTERLRERRDSILRAREAIDSRLRMGAKVVPLRKAERSD